MKINNICVHHQAGTLTFKQVNDEHKKRWPEAPSELLPNTWIGYNFIINKDGSWKQFRYIGEETCAQKGHNTDTVSICLQGNFTKGVELPTKAQKEKLIWFIHGLVEGKAETMGFAVKNGTVIDIPNTNIFPHRVMQPNHTECFGNALSDDWARLLAYPNNNSLTEEEKETVELGLNVISQASRFSQLTKPLMELLNAISGFLLNKK